MKYPKKSSLKRHRIVADALMQVIDRMREDTSDRDQSLGQLRERMRTLRGLLDDFRGLAARMGREGVDTEENREVFDYLSDRWVRLCMMATSRGWDASDALPDEYLDGELVRARRELEAISATLGVPSVGVARVDVIDALKITLRLQQDELEKVDVVLGFHEGRTRSENDRVEAIKRLQSRAHGARDYGVP
jgi:hypothetical protein